MGGGKSGPHVFKAFAVTLSDVVDCSSDEPVFAVSGLSLAVGLDEWAVVLVGELEPAVAEGSDDEESTVDEVVTAWTDANEIVGAGLSSS